MFTNRWVLSLIAVGVAAGCSDTPTAPTAAEDAQFSTLGTPSVSVVSVTGSGHTLSDIDDKRVFAFSAHRYPDGRVSGQFSLMITSSILGSENPSVTRILAEVVCVSVRGNRAWVGGVVKNSSNSDWIGRETAWTVEDGRQGGPSGDLISLMDVPNAGPGFAQSGCDAQERVPDRALEGGSLRISEGPAARNSPSAPSRDPIVGSYENQLYDDDGKNCYHYVTISRVDASTLLWENSCPYSWTLTATDDPSVYAIGPDSPYYDSPSNEDMMVLFAADGSVLFITGPGLEPYDRVDDDYAPSTSRYIASGGGTVDVTAGRSTYAFHANVDASGVATGQFEIHFSSVPWTIHGEVTCLVVEGNEARFGGVVTRSNASGPAYQPGQEIIWFAADGGEGPDASPDQVSSFFNHPAADCTAPTWNVKDWTNGNVQIQALPG